MYNHWIVPYMFYVDWNSKMDATIKVYDLMGDI